LRDISFIQDPPNPEGIDGKRDVANRHLGAFGFPAPYGHAPLDFPKIGFNMDIVGGATASLCEALTHAVTGGDVNLHFDRETDLVAVASPYTHDALTVTAKQETPISVRIPSWVDRAQLTVTGAEGAVEATGTRLNFAPQPAGTRIAIAFPLTEREIVLNHRTRQIRTRLKGDLVTAMDNFGANFTFFPEIA
jgi:hypothetical protein